MRVMAARKLVQDINAGFRPTPYLSWCAVYEDLAQIVAMAREAAAGAQARVVRGPVGHPVLLLGDVVAAVRIRFERQEAAPAWWRG